MKKIISILLAVSILIGCSVLSAFAQQDKEYVPTTEELQAQEAANTNEKVDTIFGLGIIERNTEDLMDLSGKATRMDVVIWLYRMFNYSNKDDVRQASKAYFNDISTQHYAAGYIEDMVSRGIVSGYGDNTFRPENVITYDEIKTLLIRAAGYDSDSSVIFKGAFSDDDKDGVTRKTAAELLYNLMFTDIVPAHKREEYKNSDKEEFIKYVMGLDYFDGILDGVGGVSLYDKSIPKEQISVGGKTYATACDFSDEYLGYHGCCYIDIDADDTVVFFYPSEKNQILELTSEQIEDYQAREYTYYTENDKLKRAKILKGFDCVYNGYYNEDTTLMVPEYGSVKLISNDNNNEYDVVVIEDIKSYVVDRVINDREIIFKNVDENGSNIIIDVEVLDECEIYLESGSLTTISAIKSGSVVNVIQNSANRAKLYVSNKKITGRPSAIFIEDGYSHMTVNGTTYKPVPGMYKDNWDGTSLINLSLLLDVNNRIAGVFVASAEGWQYGYIMRMNYYEEERSKVGLRLLKEDGKIEYIICAETVYIDGEKEENPLEAHTKLSNAYTNFDDYTGLDASGQISEVKENFTTRIVRFFLNADGEILKIDTPVNRSVYEESGNVADNEDVLGIRSKGNLYYAPNQNMMKVVYKSYAEILGDALLNSGARVFVIPEQDNENPDDDDYCVYSNLKDVGFNQYGEFCYASGYNINAESLGCDVIVVRKSAGSSEGRGVLVFDSLYKAYDEDEGEVVDTIKYMSKGQVNEKKIDKDDITIDTSILRKGDVLLYRIRNNEVVIDEVLYSSSGAGTLNSASTWPVAGDRHFNISYRVIAGKVAKTDGDIIHIKVEDTSLFDEMVKTSSISVYDVSSGRSGEIFKTTAAKLRTVEKNPENADTIIVSSKGGSIQDVIVVRY